MSARRPRLWARPGTSLLVVLALLTAGMAAALATEPAARSDAASATGPRPVVSVARATAACPDPVVDVGTTSRVALAAPGPSGPGARSTGGAAGQASLSDLDGSPLAEVEAPGSVAVDVPEERAGPLVARGSARSAPGLTASQVTRSTEATMRGLAGTGCPASGTEFWFVGSGAVVGQRGRVYLTNAEPVPAVVDVLLHGPDGPIDAPDGRGVSVAPGEQEVRLLDALSPGTERFAVHVVVRQGRVSAAVRDQQVDGLTPLGADWVPAAVPPAGTVLVPGVPGGDGERRLQVVAPGDSDAIVRLRLVTESGTSAPTGLDVLEVAAGSVSDVDLAPHTAGEPVAVELSADVPVTAGVLAEVAGPAGQLGEIAYVAAQPSLSPLEPGAVPEVRQGAGLTNRLLLAAPAGDVTVDLTPLPPAGGSSTEVRVPGGSQLTVDLATVSPAESFALRVLPQGGPVLAVHQVDEAEARGPFVTSLPVLPGRYSVPVPLVVADLSTGLGAGG